jgi:hypothetical protein
VSLYRVLPLGFVLPSLQPFAEGQTAFLSVVHGLLALLDPQGVAAMVQREREAHEAASSVPCPAFVCGPPVLGVRVRPAATPLPGDGRSVLA